MAKINNIDNWRHRSTTMKCATCMWFVPKETKTRRKKVADRVFTLGRCRKHAPTLNGYPAVFITDFCGDHKLDEVI